MQPEISSIQHTLPATESADEMRALIDRIILLSTLVSDRKTIDPLMDGLRNVTSRWNGTQALNSEDQRILNNLEAKLKHYLINDDPLRKFTAQSLQAELQNKTSGTSTRRLVWVVVISLASGSLAFLLPFFSISLQTSALVSIPLFFLALHIGIAWFYLSALKNFNQEFRRAFILICCGILLLSVFYSHYIITPLLNLGDHPLFRYGGLTSLLTTCFVLIYFGLRKYARLLDIKNAFTSLPVLGTAAVVTSGAAILVPHAKPNPALEPFFDLSLVSVWLLALFLLFSIGVARQIAKRVTPGYSKSMKWLYYYLIIGFLGAMGSSTAIPVLGELKGNTLNMMNALLGIGPQMVLLYTGYLFKRGTNK